MTIKKPTSRATTKAEDDALEEGVSIRYDGNNYEIRAGDMNALHERRLRREYGLPFAGLLNEFYASPGFDSIAAIVWLARYMNGEDALTFDEVAEGVDARFVEKIEIITPDGPGEVDGSPEA